jgi:predicted permease
VRRTPKSLSKNPPNSRTPSGGRYIVRSVVTAWADLRYALRVLRANPVFTAVAVVSLALGIGVNTAIFSLVDQLLLWSVPARSPEQLVNVKGGRSMTYPFYVEYRKRNQVFTGMFAASFPQASGVRPQGAASVETGRVSYVSGSYFETLGVGAAAGRVILDSDDVKPGGSPVLVLSYGYWQSRFAGKLDAVGQKIAVNGYPFDIVGVAQKGFTGLFNGHRADAFVPLTMYPVTTPAAASVWNTPGMHWLYTMGRLKPGMTLDQAQAGMRVLWPRVVEAVNDSIVRNGGKTRKYNQEEQITLIPGGHGVSSGANPMLDPLKALAAATGLVLLIACANVANLLLARAVARRREIAVRMAVGASRARLIRQLLTESAVLAVIGGAAGLAVAWWGILALARSDIVYRDLRLQPSLGVAALSVAATLATALLFGLAPAIRATRASLTEAIKDGGAASQSGSRLWFGKALVAGQTALSVTLLVGAGLFIRTLVTLKSTDIGFHRENIVIFDIDPTALGYKGHRLRTFYEELLEKTRGVSGVHSAALSGMTPMGEYARSRTFSAEGYQPREGERLVAYSNPVSSQYFTTLGIPMLLGRDFRRGDEPAITPGDNFMASIGRMSGGSSEKSEHASRVCIINESLARHLFGGANPIGRHVSYDDRYSAEGALEIIGVVKDVHHSAIRKSDEIGVIYVPSWGDGAEARWLEARITGHEAPVIAAVRRQLQEIDSNVALLRTRTMEEYVNATLQRERLVAYLSGFFGVLALGLAAVGLYGLMANAVSRRTRELGIRMALGARGQDVMAMVVIESLIPVAMGVIVGIAGALLAARLVAGLLYGVAPQDPVSIGIAAATMLAVAALAAAVPARRASRVEPLIALRYE